MKTKAQDRVKKVVAYQVSEDYEGHSAIVFASSSAAARREGANELDQEWETVSCTRLQWADEYAPGPVPDLVKVDNGWWITCNGCEVRVDNGLEAYDSYTGVTRRLRPVEDDRGFFCCVGCRTSYLADREARKRAEQRVLNTLTTRLSKTLPTATPIKGWMDRIGHVYVARDKVTRRYVAEQAYVNFTFPGSKYDSGKLGLEKKGEAPTITVCVGDLEAFKAWKAAGYPAQVGEWLNGLEQMESVNG